MIHTNNDALFIIIDFYVECNNDTDTNEILQLPEYDENGRMKFIPRIVGGSTAQAGQFHGIVRFFLFQ